MGEAEAECGGEVDMVAAERDEREGGGSSDWKRGRAEGNGQSDGQRKRTKHEMKREEKQNRFCTKKRRGERGSEAEERATYPATAEGGSEGLRKRGRELGHEGRAKKAAGNSQTSGSP
jgi:hypothetical protein